MSPDAAAPQPVFFCAHGSPMNALGNSAFARSLSGWGRGWPACRAILLVSAHWRATQARLTGAAWPETVHDFFGFPVELDALRYPAPGDPALALRVAGLLAAAGFESGVDQARGLDHGAWAPLRVALPEAEVPVVQLSLLRASPARHLELGAVLRPLRDEGVLIVGSGNLVHNLGTAVLEDVGAPAAAWSREFDQWVAERLRAGDHADLAGYATRQRHGALAHPTDEHYLPVLVAAGAAGAEARVSFPVEGFEHGTLSLRCVRFD